MTQQDTCSDRRAHGVLYSPKGRSNSLDFMALWRFPKEDAMMLNLKSYLSERRKAFQAWRMASMGQVAEGSGSRQGQKS